MFYVAERTSDGAYHVAEHTSSCVQSESRTYDISTYICYTRQMAIRVTAGGSPGWVARAGLQGGSLATLSGTHTHTHTNTHANKQRKPNLPAPHTPFVPKGSNKSLLGKPSL